ncbi:hypothetical protein L1887_51444 [Cichorium endivia]|nr:hypothetical protein L1887_51444 [Cichorium endivia]
MVTVAFLPAAPERCCLDIDSLIATLPASIRVARHVDAATDALVWLPNIAQGNTAPEVARLLEGSNVKWVQLPMTGVDDYMPIIRATRGLLCGRGGGTYSGAGSEHHARAASAAPARHDARRHAAWKAGGRGGQRHHRQGTRQDAASSWMCGLDPRFCFGSRVGKGRCRGAGMSTHGHNDASGQPRHVGPTAPRCAVGQCGEGRGGAYACSHQRHPLRPKGCCRRAGPVRARHATEGGGAEAGGRGNTACHAALGCTHAYRPPGARREDQAESSPHRAGNLARLHWHRRSRQGLLALPVA